MLERIKLGLLGDNLGRSRAKHLHEMLGGLYGLDVTYEPMDLIGRPKPVSIARELERCRQEGFRGVNVTHPYKMEAFAHVKTVPGFPQGLSSVNTVLFSQAEDLADNTDYSGCCSAFATLFNDKLKPGRVLMLGAGGVGVAIAYALLQAGASELVIHDIKQDAARILVEQMSARGLAVRLAGDDLAAEMQRADGLINATPLGMFQYPGNAFPLAGFGGQSWAFDAVYTPQYTEFLKECQKHSIEILTGFYLFLYQGLNAFERFAGIVPEAKKVETLFLERHPLE